MKYLSTFAKIAKMPRNHIAGRQLRRHYLPVISRLLQSVGCRSINEAYWQASNDDICDDSLFHTSARAIFRHDNDDEYEINRHCALANLIVTSIIDENT